jgi:hypothetical protein
MYMKLGTQLGMCALVFMSTACNQEATMPHADEMPGLNKPVSEVQEMNKNFLPDSISMDQQVSGAVADLAVRTGIGADAITINQARSVNWGSGAVGCPKEGMNYTQAIVPGVLVLLEAAGTVYRYHGQTGRSLSFCPDDRAEAPAYGPGEELM